MNVFSTALSGLNAATRRLESVASNVANKDSRGALPTNTAQGVKQPYQPIRIEQSSTAGAGGPAGTTATLRSTTPAYLAVYDPTANYADENGFVAEPNVDLVQETVEETEFERGIPGERKDARSGQRAGETPLRSRLLRLLMQPR